MRRLGSVKTVRGEEVEYQSWKKAFRISNDTVQLIVLTEVGPRILFFGFHEEENEFYDASDASRQSSDGEFKVYGGHRLWVSPEVARTYYPDNVPISVRSKDEAFVFTAPPESVPPGTNLQKEIEIKLAETGTEVTVTHRILNLGEESTEMAPWALSVMAGGGRAILPFAPKAPISPSRLLPEGVLTLWSYTDLADPRWKIGTKYLQLRQEKNSASQFKEQMAGIFNPSGWGAYFRSGHLFMKKAQVEEGAKYPDYGCNFEIYTDSNSLELETLGPVRDLKPGEAAELIEHWCLFKDIEEGESESWVDAEILSRVQDRDENG